MKTPRFENTTRGSDAASLIVFLSGIADGRPTERDRLVAWRCLNRGRRRTVVHIPGASLAEVGNDH